MRVYSVRSGQDADPLFQSTLPAHCSKGKEGIQEFQHLASLRSLALTPPATEGGGGLGCFNPHTQQPVGCERIHNFNSLKSGGQPDPKRGSGGL